jgi:uncharacterized SAM-binding protein YcdF (DUF218 family)
MVAIMRGTRLGARFDRAAARVASADIRPNARTISPITDVEEFERWAKGAADERARTLRTVPRSPHAVLVLGYSQAGLPVLNSQMLARLQVALQRLEEDPESIALVSGGTSYTPISEAQAMKDWLVANGVPSSRVVAEGTARFTAENIGLAVPILEKAGVKRVTLVTGRFHLPRATLLMSRAMHESLRGVTLRLAPAPDGLHGAGLRRNAVSEAQALIRDWRGWKETVAALPSGGTLPIGS